MCVGHLLDTSNHSIIYVIPPFSFVQTDDAIRQEISCFTNLTSRIDKIYLQKYNRKNTMEQERGRRKGTHSRHIFLSSWEISYPIGTVFYLIPESLPSSLNEPQKSKHTNHINSKSWDIAAQAWSWGKYTKDVIMFTYGQRHY